MRYLCVFAVAAGLVFGQSTPSEFEAAVIRPHKDGDTSSSTNLRPGGRVEARNVPLLRMIMAAYDVTEYQIVGGPAWIREDRWDLDAKAEGLPANAQPDQVLPLLKKLVEDRFGLQVRRELRPMPAYRLAVDRGGHKMTPATDAGLGGSARTQNGVKSMRIEAKHMPMKEFAQTLSRRLDRPIVDRTELAGNYDFTLEWSPDPVAADDGAGASVFTAIREQLGLRLESAREDVEVLVIVGAERPAGN
jgi:uncharacterized protein (TIGR03435 family)